MIPTQSKWSEFVSSLHPKVIAATLGSLLASILLGLIVSIQASPDIMGGLPPIVVFIFTASVPTVVTFLSGYAKAAPAQNGSGA